MVNRYGKGPAIAIMASAQVLGWGALGVGALIGVPLYLPGVSIWGTAPAAAVAETILRASRGVKAVRDRLRGRRPVAHSSVPGEMSGDGGPEDPAVEREARHFRDAVERTYLDWLRRNSARVRAAARADGQDPYRPADVPVPRARPSANALTVELPADEAWVLYTINCGGPGSGVPGPCPDPDKQEPKGFVGRVKAAAGRLGAKAASLADRVPGLKQVKAFATKTLAKINDKLTARYGPKVAKTIMLGSTAGTGYAVAALALKFVGLPGVPVVNDLIGIAINTAIAETVRQIGRAGKAVGRGAARVKARLATNARPSPGLTHAAGVVASALAREIAPAVKEAHGQIVAALRADPALRAEAERLTGKTFREPTPLSNRLVPLGNGESFFGRCGRDAKGRCEAEGGGGGPGGGKPKKQAGFEMIPGVRSVKKAKDHEYTGTYLVTLDDGSVHAIYFDRQGGLWHHSRPKGSRNQDSWLATDRRDVLTRLLARVNDFHPEPTTDRRPVGNTGRWAAMPDPDKLRAFRDWVAGRLGVSLEGADEEALWRAYTEAGFRQGAGRSFDDVNAAARAAAASESVGAAGASRKVASKTPSIASTLRDKLSFYAGTREQFLRSAMARPVAVERLKVLAARSFEELKGITKTMATRMVRVLADGFVRGDGPRVIARALSREIDLARDRAVTVARTEVIRAHADGQLQSLKEMGVEEVGVAVEWAVVRDRDGNPDPHVCPLCLPLDGVILKLEEAEGMLPRHPNCRCAWIPANVGETSRGKGPRTKQLRSKTEIDRAIAKSTRREEGKPPTDWAGEDKTIGRRRPRPLGNERFNWSLLSAVNTKGDFFGRREGGVNGFARKVEAPAVNWYPAASLGPVEAATRFDVINRKTGGTCGVGQTARQTGCVPGAGEPADDLSRPIGPEDVARLVEEDRKAWGYRGEVRVEDGDGKEFEVGNVKWREAGNCRLSDGRVTLFKGHDWGNAGNLRWTTSHELMHGTYEHVHRQYLKEREEVSRKEREAVERASASVPKYADWQEKNAAIEKASLTKRDGSLKEEYVKEFPTYARLHKYLDGPGYSQLPKDDGVTGYSRAYWKDHSVGKVETHVAIHETLAEIAAGHAKTGGLEGSKLFRNFYMTVRDEYKVLTGQQSARRQVENAGGTGHLLYLDDRFNPTSKQNATWLKWWKGDRTGIASRSSPAVNRETAPSLNCGGEGSGVPGPCPTGRKAEAPEARNTTKAVKYLADKIKTLSRAKGGHNLVHLGDLREAVPEWTDQDFRSVLTAARRAGRVSLSAAEGRHGLTERDHKYGLREKSGNPSAPENFLLYASLRGVLNWSPFMGMNTLGDRGFYLNEAGTCEKGQTAKQTGCTPATPGGETAGASPRTAAEPAGKKPADGKAPEGVKPSKAKLVALGGDGRLHSAEEHTKLAKEAEDNARKALVESKKAHDGGDHAASLRHLAEYNRLLAIHQGHSGAVKRMADTEEALRKSGLADSVEHLAGLVGAPDDARVAVSINRVGSSSLPGSHATVYVDHPMYTAARSVAMDAEGNKSIHNDSFFMKSQKGTGLGTKVFSDQVANMRASGYDHIETWAAKGPGMNGFYTWARLGYDQKISEFRDKRTRDRILKSFPDAKSIQDVMATPEGRAWWKKNGTNMRHAVFDLKEGSRSLKVLGEYLKERAERGKKPTSNRLGPVGNDRPTEDDLDHPVDLHHAEEIVLDWDDVGGTEDKKGDEK
jgi:SPP1 gp7 family putative phage head morphogenesis protein